MHLLGDNHHKIYQGDALEVLRNDIPDKSADLVFADPPYNIGKDFDGLKDKWKTEGEYLDWCYAWLEGCINKLKPNGSMYVMTSTQFMPFFDLYLRDKLHVLSRIVWHYDSSGVQAKKYFGSLYEPILFCVKDKKNYVFNAEDIQVEAKTGAKRKLIDYRKNPPQVYNATKVPGNVWNFPRVRFRMPEYREHPTQKPAALLRRIILASSLESGVVLDPFAGTFTTAAVAQSLGRKSVSIEINKAYAEIGLERLGFSSARKPDFKNEASENTLTLFS